MNTEFPEIRLLVSVRSKEEAEAAVAGGADLIDVKEPSNGPLGRAEIEVVRDVQATVQGRRPVSAAMGELADWRNEDVADGLTFLKWGLANTGSAFDWRAKLDHLASRFGEERLVPVAYADCQCARAPDPFEILAFAIESRFTAVLIDTYCKTAAREGLRTPTLLDWQTLGDVSRFCEIARDGGLKVALAGGLNVDAISTLATVEPDWFGVRGAACERSDRSAFISAARVRSLKSHLAVIADQRRLANSQRG